MYAQTPLVENLPVRLLRNIEYEKKPMVEGVLAEPFGDLVFSDIEVANDQIKASIELSCLAPDEDKIWQSTHAEMLKESLAYFFAEVIRGPDKAPYFGRSLVGRHHEDWDRVVNEHDRIVLLASRDHGKSHYFSLAYLIWKAGFREPGSLGYLFSSTQETASALLGIVKEELLNNPILEFLLPKDRDNRWSKREIHLRNGSVIRARGYGVKVRGGHPDWIIVDDSLTDNDIYSETVRRKNIDYYLSAITNMIVPGGQIIVVGTPMHELDLYGYLKRTGEYFYREYPAIDKQGRILFPERYDRKRLEARKREVGVSRFGREFLVTPLSDEASLFPGRLFEGADVRLQYCLGLDYEYWSERGMLLYTGVDLAMSAEVGADYMWIFTVAVDEFGNRWVANIEYHQGLKYQSQLDRIQEEYVLRKPELIFVESNQYQRVISEELIRTSDLPIVPFHTSANCPPKNTRGHAGKLTIGKHNLERGIPALRISFENKKWRIPRGDKNSIEKTDYWIGQMSAMSIADGKVLSVGEHDDGVLSCWMADAAARHGATFKFTMDVTEEEEKKIKELPEDLNMDYPSDDKPLKAPSAQDILEFKY